MKLELTKKELQLIEDLLYQELEAIEDMDDDAKGYGTYETRINKVVTKVSKLNQRTKS